MIKLKRYTFEVCVFFVPDAPLLPASHWNGEEWHIESVVFLDRFPWMAAFIMKMVVLWKARKNLLRMKSLQIWEIHYEEGSPSTKE